MKNLLPLIVVTVLLYGCPDSKAPKMPPQAPQPKVAAGALPSLPDAQSNKTQHAIKLIALNDKNQPSSSG